MTRDAVDKGYEIINKIDAIEAFESLMINATLSSDENYDSDFDERVRNSMMVIARDVTFNDNHNLTSGHISMGINLGYLDFDFRCAMEKFLRGYINNLVNELNNLDPNFEYED